MFEYFLCSNNEVLRVRLQFILFVHRNALHARWLKNIEIARRIFAQRVLSTELVKSIVDGVKTTSSARLFLKRKDSV